MAVARAQQNDAQHLLAEKASYLRRLYRLIRGCRAAQRGRVRSAMTDMLNAASDPRKEAAGARARNAVEDLNVQVIRSYSWAAAESPKKLAV